MFLNLNLSYITYYKYKLLRVYIVILTILILLNCIYYFSLPIKAATPYGGFLSICVCIYNLIHVYWDQLKLMFYSS